MLKNPCGMKNQTIREVRKNGLSQYIATLYIFFSAIIIYG